MQFWYLHHPALSDSLHVSKPVNSATGVPEVEEPMAAGRKLFRFIFYLAALLSLGGVAYHKMEVVRQICKEYQGPLKFKAKELERASKRATTRLTLP